MKFLALIGQTFRELKSKATLAVLVGISTIIILVVLIGLSVTETASGSMLMLFGNPVSPELPFDKMVFLVTEVQSGLANGLYAGLVLFGVFATAGLIPEMLEKGTIDLFLSKPIARWALLSGKYAGAAVVVLGNVLYFIGSLWLIFGAKTGVWNLNFLLSALTVTFVFACLYAIVVVLGVVSRNTALSIIGAFLYLFVISSLLYHREQSLYLISANGLYRGAVDGLYYVLPQLSAMQDNIARQITNGTIDWRPFLQSTLSSAVIFAGGAALFSRKDF